MTVKEIDESSGGSQPDVTKPLPPDARNLAFLLELPAAAIGESIFALLAERGFGDIRPVHQVVFETVGGDGSRLTDMAAAAKLTKQAMQYAVDDLERLGYAERIPDPQDRRAKLVRLTPRGREAVLVARDAIAATEQAWRRLLGERKMDDVRRLLEELVDRLAAAGKLPSSDRETAGPAVS